MPDTWTREATVRLNRHAGGFDPAIWFPWVMAILTRLMDCKPDPEDAYDYLTWRPRPWLDWFGTRLSRHRIAIRDAAGDAQTPPGGWKALWDAIDAGELDRPLMRHLYAEARIRG